MKRKVENSDGVIWAYIKTISFKLRMYCVNSVRGENWW